MSVEDHYDKDYFIRQKNDFDIKGQRLYDLFFPYIYDRELVLDFGCGPGAFLNKLGRGTGVEINSSARAFAKSIGIDVVPDLSFLSDNTYDAAISHHALEHTKNPYEILFSIYNKLKPGGLLVFVIPCDIAGYRFSENDRDMHLYSWSANNIGNLAKACGFSVQEARDLRIAAPPKWQFIYRTFGSPAFYTLARISRRPCGPG